MCEHTGQIRMCGACRDADLADLARRLEVAAMDRAWAIEYDQMVEQGVLEPPGPPPAGWRLTRRGRAVLIGALFLAAFLFGLLVDGPYDVPLCQEDEVVLYTGACWPLDDARFTERGWVPAEGRMEPSAQQAASGIQT